uniref:Uncharacterized protein n=1 Tax=Timema monikensis TaxID=170555 RepID=A0A7R9HJN9_9NEOP|nr:unnamed protein product [Timema monikensis]
MGLLYSSDIPSLRSRDTDAATAMPEETKVPEVTKMPEVDGVENGPDSPSPSKKKVVINKGKLVLARVTLLDGTLLDVNIEKDSNYQDRYPSSSRNEGQCCQSVNNGLAKSSLLSQTVYECDITKNEKFRGLELVDILNDDHEMMEYVTNCLTLVKLVTSENVRTGVERSASEECLLALEAYYSSRDCVLQPKTFHQE